MDTDGNTLALCKIVAVHRAANNAAREPAVLQRFPSISIQPRPCLLGGDARLAKPACWNAREKKKDMSGDFMGGDARLAKPACWKVKGERRAKDMNGGLH